MEARTKCRVCGNDFSGRFCSSCGAAAKVDDTATQTVTHSVPSSKLRSSFAGSSHASSQQNGRFLPGTVLAGRYRIVAMLGKGGMGEVYRADDLTLDQPVALKFLPEAAQDNPGALDRFRNEVRIARRVSHPNVCRMYDVGEVEGKVFLSMEYVDGEDLGSLLRRIGRLPGDKGIEIARKLCAGLAAAHEQGVLHRDLKPANIMLDARGQVLIADFGLAAFSGEVEGAEVRNGTPAYMAPEQLSGKEATTRSDIYSLGLVLYELFTGKRPFEADTLAEMVRARTDRTPTSVTTLVPDLDPTVERVIGRCLEGDPALRPASALAVAAALPGGDPLAAALAAGETPSPHLVANAGESGALSPRVAIPCAVGVLAGLIAVILFGRAGAMDKFGLEDSPEIFAREARDILQHLGYPGRPADSATGFAYDNDFINYLQSGKQHPDWNKVMGETPSPIYFWYRQSPEPLEAIDFHTDRMTFGIVSESDPPSPNSGMAKLRLNPHGKLTYLEIVPPQKEKNPSPAQPPDWSALFTAAGLDIAQFQTAEPLWAAAVDSDSRAAWTGIWPVSSRPLRVEAAAWRGKPVFFSLIGPWEEAHRMPRDGGRNIFGVIFPWTVFLAGVILARRNWQQGKGDRRGAWRLAVFMFALHQSLWVFSAHLVLDSSIFGPLLVTTGTAMFWAAIVWFFYLAIEPFVRRYWPQAIISWSRVLAGRIRDPLVGRDVLFGAVFGVGWSLILEFMIFFMGRQGSAPSFGNTDYLGSIRRILGAVLQQAPGSIRGTLILFLILFGLKALLRKQWIALIGFVVIQLIPTLSGSQHKVIEGSAMALIYSIAALMVLRFGLVALTTALFSTNTLLNVPMTLDTSAWYFPAFALVVLMILALAAWGFHTSLAGKPLWKDELIS